MLKFLKKTETTLMGKLGNIALGFMVMATWTLGVVYFYDWLFKVESWNPFEQMGRFKHPLLVEIFLACIMAPLWEEVVFRKFPLDVIKASKKEELLIPTMLFTSVIFGLGHYGVPSLLIQGVGGFVMSAVYIKNGFSYWSSCFMHFLWNASLMFGVLNL